MKYRVFVFINGPARIVETPLKSTHINDGVTTTTDLEIEADTISDALEKFIPSFKAFEAKLMKDLTLVGFRMELIHEPAGESGRAG